MVVDTGIKMVGLDVLQDDIIKEFLQTKKCPISYNDDGAVNKDVIINDLIHGHHLLLQNMTRRFIDKKAIDLSNDAESFIEIPKSIQMLTEKKSHEIINLMKFIGSKYKNLNIEFIVDVGSGNSYLSRILSKRYKLIIVERDDVKVKQSKKIDSLMGIKANDVHYIKDLTEFDSISHFVNSNKSKNEILPNGLLIGLNSCGDLPNKMLQLYTTNDNAKILNLVGCVVVGCCFHKSTRFISQELSKIEDYPFNLLKSQDLDFLTNDEIIQSYNESNEGLDFVEWCFIKGFMTNLTENLLHLDRLLYLEENTDKRNNKVNVIFQTSRNVVISSTI